jgi:hypothetical protein
MLDACIMNPHSKSEHTALLFASEEFTAASLSILRSSPLKNPSQLISTIKEVL